MNKFIMRVLPKGCLWRIGFEVHKYFLVSYLIEKQNFINKLY